MTERQGVAEQPSQEASVACRAPCHTVTRSRAFTAARTCVLLRIPRMCASAATSINSYNVQVRERFPATKRKADEQHATQQWPLARCACAACVIACVLPGCAHTKRMHHHVCAVCHLARERGGMGFHNEVSILEDLNRAAAPHMWSARPWHHTPLVGSGGTGPWVPGVDVLEQHHFDPPVRGEHVLV